MSHNYWKTFGLIVTATITMTSITTLLAAPAVTNHRESSDNSHQSEVTAATTTTTTTTRGNPYREPIFRVTESPLEQEDQAGALSSPQPDTGAYIEVSNMTQETLDHLRQTIFRTTPLKFATLERPLFRLALALALERMNSALEVYRNTQVLDEGQVQRRRRPAIRLGDTQPEGEPLGANINNYAPDNFGVDEIMGLFEMNELLRATGGGEWKASASDSKPPSPPSPPPPSSSLKEINQRVLDSYVGAIAGIPAANKCDHIDHQGDEEDNCAICQESLQIEPCVKLPCAHKLHLECAKTWARPEDWSVKSCAYCGQIFRLPWN